MNLQTGDIVFVIGRGWVANTIRFFMGGIVNHVGIMYDEDTIFETDGKWRKAKFDTVNRYDWQNILVYRFNHITDEQQDEVMDLCESLEGRPYSYWECTVNAVFSVFNSRIRGKVASMLGNSRFMKCDEMVKYIVYRAFDFIHFKNHEAGDPNSMLETVQRSTQFHRVL